MRIFEAPHSRNSFEMFTLTRFVARKRRLVIALSKRLCINILTDNVVFKKLDLTEENLIACKSVTADDG